MSHSNVSHNFAHDSQTGKASGNMFYEGSGPGSTLYSYGYHFAIATKYAKNKALFTLAEYSNTTSRHKGHAASALSHYELIYVPRNTDGYKFENGKLCTYKETPYKEYLENDVLYFAEELENLALKHKRARKYSYAREIRQTIENAHKFCQLFKIPRRLIPKALKTVLDAHQKSGNGLDAVFGTDYAKEAEKREAEQKKREAEKLKKALEEWRAGENVYLNSNFTYLRLNGKTLETSKNIRIDVKSEKATIFKILKAVEYCKRNKKEIQPKNAFLAHYNVDKIDVTGNVRAGCHLVKYSEIQAIKPQILNLIG